MDDDRRRTRLGSATSAAIPLLWQMLATQGSQAKLATHLDEDSGNVSRLLYGDRKAGRALSVKLLALGVPIESWDEPLPEGWTVPHAADRTGPQQVVTAADADALTRTG